MSEKKNEKKTNSGGKPLDSVWEKISKEVAIDYGGVAKALDAGCIFRAQLSHTSGYGRWRYLQRWLVVATTQHGRKKIGLGANITAHVGRTFVGHYKSGVIRRYLDSFGESNAAATRTAALLNSITRQI